MTLKTSNEVQKIIAFLCDRTDISLKEISENIGHDHKTVSKYNYLNPTKTRGQCTSRLYTIGKKRRKPRNLNKYDRMMIYLLRQYTTFTVNRIASELNISRSTIDRCEKELKSRLNKKDNEILRLATRLYKKLEFPQRKISKELGIIESKLLLQKEPSAAKSPINDPYKSGSIEQRMGPSGAYISMVNRVKSLCNKDLELCGMTPKNLEILIRNYIKRFITLPTEDPF